MSGRDDREAWGSFWDGGSADRGCACSPNNQVEQAQRAVWRSFAAALPRRGKVLDLATGAGAVLAMLQQARPDLRLIGIDSAPAVPRPPKGLVLHAGIALEQLPYAAKSFDAVTSQFGYEYGRTEEAAPEIERVLRPGGRLQLIVHRHDGPIVEHSLRRRQALRWALEGEWFAQARSIMNARRTFDMPTPSNFGALDEAQHRFPQTSAAAELLQAVAETLRRGRHHPPEDSLQVLTTLEVKARGEIARLEALERAARDDDGINRLVDELESTGLAVEPPADLCEPGSTRPFAWLVSGAKRLA